MKLKILELHFKISPHYQRCPVENRKRLAVVLRNLIDSVLEMSNNLHFSLVLNSLQIFQ